MKFTGCGLHMTYSKVMHVLSVFSSVNIKEEVVVTSVYIVQTVSNFTFDKGPSLKTLTCHLGVLTIASHTGNRK